MQCQNCGFENLPDTSECINCHGNIVSSIPKLDIKLRRHPIRRQIDRVFYGLRMRFSRSPVIEHYLGTSDLIPVRESFWLALRYLFNPQVGVSIFYQNPWIAVFLSLFPGLGQIYKKEYRKGCIYFSLWIVSIIVAMLLTGEFWGTFCWSTVLSIHAAAILDALTSKLITLSLRETLFFNLVILIVVYMVYTRICTPYFNTLLISGSNQQAPCLEEGDRVLVSEFPYINNYPKRGDIVYYRFPGMESYAMSEGRVVLVAGNVIEKIIGMSGDTIVLKENQIWVNNAPLSKDLYPLSLADIKPEMETKIVVPENSYFIYLSAPFNRVVDGNTRLSYSVVPNINIKGKVILRYLPFDRFQFF